MTALPCFVFGAQYSDVAPLIKAKCTGCHMGPYLDLRTFPFYSDSFPAQRALLEEILRRASLSTWQRMPPVNFPAVEESDIRLLQEWYETGTDLGDCDGPLRRFSGGDDS